MSRMKKLTFTINKNLKMSCFAGILNYSKTRFLSFFYHDFQRKFNQVLEVSSILSMQKHRFRKKYTRKSLGTLSKVNHKFAHRWILQKCFFFTHVIIAAGRRCATFPYNISRVLTTVY